MSRRVAEWTQRLEPILQQQEEAEQFDIHVYCDHFMLDVEDVITRHEHEHQLLGQEKAEQEDVKQAEMSSAEDSNNSKANFDEIGFSEVACGKSSAEVCRIFLA